jgi:hypothetical protein
MSNSTDLANETAAKATENAEAAKALARAARFSLSPNAEAAYKAMEEAEAAKVRAFAARALGTPNTEDDLNALVRKHSAFKNMDDLLAQRHHGYRPTLDVANPEICKIADAYDCICIALGSPMRSYRYESPSTVKAMKALARKMARKTFVQVREG